MVGPRGLGIEPAKQNFEGRRLGTGRASPVPLKADAGALGWTKRLPWLGEGRDRRGTPERSRGAVGEPAGGVRTGHCPPLLATLEFAEEGSLCVPQGPRAPAPSRCLGPSLGSPAHRTFQRALPHVPAWGEEGCRAKRVARRAVSSRLGWEQRWHPGGPTGLLGLVFTSARRGGLPALRSPDAPSQRGLGPVQAPRACLPRPALALGGTCPSLACLLAGLQVFGGQAWRPIPLCPRTQRSSGALLSLLLLSARFSESGLQPRPPSSGPLACRCLLPLPHTWPSSRLLCLFFRICVSVPFSHPPLCLPHPRLLPR